MTSHSAAALHRWRPTEEGVIEATITLACGCVVTRRMAADRLLQLEDGGVRVVGKFPCPQGHPVRPPL